MTTPHKHAEVIKAWADGAAVQILTAGSAAGWVDLPVASEAKHAPQWNPEYEYRIKPEEPEKPQAPLTVRVMNANDDYSVCQGYPGDFFMWVADFADRAAALDYANYLCIKYAAQLCDET